MRLVGRLSFCLVVLGLLWVGRDVRMRVGANHFVFAGSDSYGYLKLADELRTHHRYALGPAPEPLHWARPPLLPVYLMLVKGSAEAKMSGGEGWGMIARANATLEILGTGLVLCLAAYFIGGAIPALIALFLMMVGPWNAIATPAALTETLATFLLTATVGACIPSAMGSRRLGWLALAGVCFALAVLTRPDSLLIAPALALAVLGAARARTSAAADLRTRALAARRPSLVLILGFSIVFLPWPIRNLVAFHDPHPLGGRIDRYSRPVENYQGSWAYLRALSKDWVPMTRLTTCYYDLSCTPTVSDFLQANATIDGVELEELRRLLVRRSATGHSREVSDGFQALADKRRRAHFFEVELKFPYKRLYSMWIADHDELLPPYAPMIAWRTKMRAWSRALACGALFGGLLMLIDRRRRLAGLVLLAATLGRTAIMAYTFYSMPRYLLESVPSAFALIAGGVAVLGALTASALRRARSRTKATSGVLSASMKT